MDQVLSGLRPFRATDIEPLARLLDVTHAWPPSGPPTPEDIYQRWQRRNVHPIDDVSVLPGPNGELIAFSQSAVFRDGTPRLAFELAVHPAYRCRGIATAFLKMVYFRAQTAGVAHLTTPVYSSVSAPRRDCPGFLEKRGFRADHSYWQMRLDNIGEQPKPVWPAGIGVRTFTDMDRDAAAWAHLIIEAFAEAATPQGIRAQIAEPGVSKEGYFFALDRATGREIGTSRGRVDMVAGKPMGYIGTVGVLPAYRGRGIAEALVKQTITYLASIGMHTATLFVEDRNTPARRLYDKLGWRLVYRTDHYWKKLEQSGEGVKH